MAIIHFTTADLLQTKVIDADIYPTEIISVGDPKKSNTGKSFSIAVEFVIVDGKYKGKQKTIMFNDGVSGNNIFGDIQMMPQTMLANVYAAVQGKSEPGTEEFSLDTEELLHKVIDVFWATDAVEGRLTNKITQFHPHGYAKSAPAF